MRSAVFGLVASGCGLVGIDAVAPPTTSERATPFTLVNSAERPTELATLLATTDVVLVFYRGHW